MNKRIKGLIFIDSMAKTSSYLIVAILSVYVLSLNGNLTHYGDLIGIFAISYGIIRVVCSKFLLKYKAFLLPFSYLLWILYSIILIVSVNSIYILYCAILLNGIALSIRGVMFFSKLQDLCPDKEVLNLIQSKYSFIGCIPC